MKSRGLRLTVAGAATFISASVVTLAWPLCCSLAWALPHRGEAVPAVSVTDVEGHAHPMVVARPGVAQLILYQDRNADGQNSRLDPLLDKVQRPENRRLVEITPVADISNYDFWPARGFAVDGVKKRIEQDGQLIYCDLRGAVRKAWGLTRGKSDVILLGGDGKVRFFAEGPVSAEQERELVAELRAIGVTL